jgi:catechol 2,3-dioxygenase-like lactoylglutathione lyase family enzyme
MREDRPGMRISRLTLATIDPEAQAAFWGDRLGLSVGWVDEDEVEVRLRDGAIAFRRAAPGLDPRYHFAINLPPGSIGAAVAWLGERHELLAFHGDPDEEDGATVVRTDVGAGCLYFLDAVGNVAELISSPYVKGRGEEDFGPESLIEVAEIGLATADYDATCAAVGGFFGAEVLWGGGPGSELTAIGDHHAVVIVAPAGRGWIPVGLPARPLPTEIVAYGTEPRELTLPEGPYVLRVA